MVFGKMFKPRPAEIAGRDLYAAAVARARDRRFYADLGVPDTPEGRFELYTLHVALVLRRLKGQGPQADETGQALFDAFLGGLDIALRELGAGDLSMAKKMKKLGQHVYGRLQAFDAAFAAAPDAGPLSEVLARNIGEEADSTAIAAYALKAEALLNDAELAVLLEGRGVWPENEP